MMSTECLDNRSPKIHIATLIALCILLPLSHSQKPDVFHAEFNQGSEISSPGFPSECCSDYSFTIQLPVGEQRGYLRMTFSDLDLPKGSKLQIYDGATSRSPLFPNQPEIARGVWTRPSIASSALGGSIHVVFTNPADDAANDTYTEHVGFKVFYWVTNSPPENWHDIALPRVCTPIVSALAGQLVIQKALDFGDNHGTTVDCVWQLKVPQTGDATQLKKENLNVYARFGALDFTGYLDIKDGPSSDATTIVSLDTSSIENVALESLAQPSEGFVSSNGLYIHLTMLNEGHGVVSFVYGAFHTQTDLMDLDESDVSTSRRCDFGNWGDGFRCLSSRKSSWCIPIKNMCNGAKNCPNESDEKGSFCEPQTTVPPPTTTTTPLPSTTKATYAASKACDPSRASVMCADWTCDRENRKCRFNGGLKCNSLFNPTWCPGQGCISHTKYGYPCSGYCRKCSGGTCTLDGKCPGVCPSTRKSCKDGSCIASYNTCPGECSVWETRCSDGSCQSYSYNCPGNACSSDIQTKCDDGLKCYYSSDRCDDYDDCYDGTDERGCTSNSGAWKWIFIVPAIIICVIILIAKTKKKNSSPPVELDEDDADLNDPNVGSRTAYHSIVSRHINSGTPGYTGTRMTPVPPGSSAGMGPPPHSAVGSTPSHSHEYDMEPGPRTRLTEGDGQPAASAPPPPSYDEVVQDNETYRPLTNGEPPPPSYDSVGPSASNA